MKVYIWPEIIQLATECALCGGRSTNSGLLCRRCVAALPRNDTCCSACALPLPADSRFATEILCHQCAVTLPVYDRVIAPLRYEKPVDDLISRHKYHQDLSYGPLLGRLLADSLEPGDIARIDCLVPMPLHPSRLRMRGFNQVGEIAREVARRIDRPVADRLLRRRGKGNDQRTAGRQDRRRSVRDAFAAHETAATRRVALLDDVMTTGATVEAAALSLLSAGVSRVDIWVVARTPRKQ